MSRILFVYNSIICIVLLDMISALIVGILNNYQILMFFLGIWRQLNFKNMHQM